MVGIVDSHINYKAQEVSLLSWRKSHGDHSLEVMKASYWSVIRRALDPDQLGVVSIPERQDILYHILKGVNELIGQEVKVICMPVGFSKSTPLLEAIASTCYEKGVLLVAPAGNRGPGLVTYPGAYPSVLCVGSVDMDGEPAAYSGCLYMEEGNCLKPEILAEGVYGQGIKPTEGTSVACARVAGLAAALLEKHPALDRQGLMDVLCQSSSEVKGSRYGLLQAHKAMALAHHSEQTGEIKEKYIASFRKGWTDLWLQHSCEYAAGLGRKVRGLVAATSKQKLNQLLTDVTDHEFEILAQLTHFNVSYIEAEPACFKVFFNHPELAWASAVDVNYFD